MSGDFERALQSLRDVDGIVGSFVFDAEGAVIARDLPSFFDGSVLQQAGWRLTRLADALTDDATLAHDCMLRYDEHRISLKRLTEGYLAVLAVEGINGAQLRMAMNLVSRRMSTLPRPAVEPAPEPEPQPSAAPPATTSTMPVPRAPSVAAPEARTNANAHSARPVYFRGKRIG